MATYKVIQDIEAEDKLLGPLTLKQFIFAVITVGFAGMAFVTVTKVGNPLAAIPFLPFIAVFGFLAAPIGRDQPTEVWLAARLRFLFVPRKRIWDQNGLKELVTITAPKQDVHVYSDNLSKKEVKSRLRALSDVIDSRGWATRNVAINAYDPQPQYLQQTTDRLLNQDSLPQIVPELTMGADADILDATNNPTAQHFEELVEESTVAQKKSAIGLMQQAIKQQKEADIAVQQAQKAQELEAIAIQKAKADALVAKQARQSQALKDADDVTTNRRHSELDSESTTAVNNWIPDQARNDRPEEVVYSDEMNEPAVQAYQAPNNIPQPSKDQEDALLEHIKQDKAVERLTMPHHRTIKTPNQIARERHQKYAQKSQESNSPVPPQPSPAIINLAQNNDFSVATIAGQAKKGKQEDDFHNNDVIELH